MKQQNEPTRDGVVVAVLLVALAMVVLSSCSVMHRSKTAKAESSDSTAQTSTTLVQLVKKDSTGTIQKMDSGTAKAWWQTEKETTTQEVIDTITGKVIKRTTTIHEKSRGHTVDAHATGVIEWTQTKTTDSTAAAAAAKTTVKKKIRETGTTTTRWGTPVLVIVGVLIIMVVFIWTHWDDLILALFRKRKTTKDGNV